MFTAPHFFLHTLTPFARLFSPKVFLRALTLAQGAILTPAERTVTAALRAMGLARDKHFARYHQVLSRNCWSPRHASAILLRLLIQTFLPGTEPLVIALDDTIERRKGARIRAVGVYRDPVRSTSRNKVRVTGLRWLCAMAVLPVSWAGREWALPFATVLCPSARFYQKRKHPPRNLLQCASTLLARISRWAGERSLITLADGTFSSIWWLDRVRRWTTVITRLRLDSCLYDFPPERRPGQRGRLAKVGNAQPKLREVLEKESTPWRSVRIPNWYGQGERVMEITSGESLWYTRSKGGPALPLRWVLIRDPKGRSDPAALLSTDRSLEPERIVELFLKRWQVEVTFEEARAHLGMESQRQWSDRSIERTTPVILGLFSLVALLGQELVSRGREIVARRAAWYPKERATFSDTLAAVRHALWREELKSPGSSQEPTREKIPEATLRRIIEAACYS